MTRSGRTPGPADVPPPWEPSPADEARPTGVRRGNNGWPPANPGFPRYQPDDDPDDPDAGPAPGWPADYRGPNGAGPQVDPKPRNGHRHPRPQVDPPARHPGHPASYGQPGPPAARPAGYYEPARYDQPARYDVPAGYDDGPGAHRRGDDDAAGGYPPPEGYPGRDGWGGPAAGYPNGYGGRNGSPELPPAGYPPRYAEPVDGEQPGYYVDSNGHGAAEYPSWQQAVEAEPPDGRYPTGYVGPNGQGAPGHPPRHQSVDDEALDGRYPTGYVGPNGQRSPGYPPRYAEPAPGDLPGREALPGYIDPATEVLGRYVPANEVLDREAMVFPTTRPAAPTHPPRAVVRRRRARRRAMEWPFLVVFALVAAFLIRMFAVQTFYIPSGSMHETLVEGDRVLVNKVGYHLHDPHRGDVVVFRRPADFPVDEDDLIKRVVALPGETVQAQNRRILIDGRPLQEPYVEPACNGTDDFAPVKVPPDRLWVMGDNRCDSSDSRVFGPIDESLIVGRAFVLVWPTGRIAWL